MFRGVRAGIRGIQKLLESPTYSRIQDGGGGQRWASLSNRQTHACKFIIRVCVRALPLLQSAPFSNTLYPRLPISCLVFTAKSDYPQVLYDHLILH